MPDNPFFQPIIDRTSSLNHWPGIQQKNCIFHLFEGIIFA